MSYLFITSGPVNYSIIKTYLNSAINTRGGGGGGGGGHVSFKKSNFCISLRRCRREALWSAEKTLERFLFLTLVTNILLLFFDNFVLN